MNKVFLIAVLLILLSNVCDTISQLVLKFFINKADMHVDSVRKAFNLVFWLGKNPLAWIGLVFSSSSLFIWLFVLTKMDLNLAFSIDSMRYVLIVLASMVFLKERVGPMRWLGILTVMGGITLVTLG